MSMRVGVDRSGKIRDVPLTTEQKQAKLKAKRQKWKLKRFKISWHSEAIKVIKEKLEHYEKTGNLRKADIYRRKLEGTHDISDMISKLNPFNKSIIDNL